MTDYFLIQHKEVQSGTKSHTIKWGEVMELRSNAVDENKIPVYMIDVKDHYKSYYMIRQEEFELLQQYMKDEDELIQSTQHVR